MNRLPPLAVAAALALPLIGCEETTVPLDPNPNPAPDPTAQADPPTVRADQELVSPVAPAAPAAPVVPPEPVEPLPAVMTMGGEVIEFPPAVLHLLPATGADGAAETKAVFYSDDPEEALRPGWAGDSFYFEMRFAGDPSAVLTPAPDGSMPLWQVYAPDSSRRDTPNGLFLDGDRVTLQPVDAAVAIDPRRDEGDTAVEVDGLFRRFRGGDEHGEVIRVRARVYPAVQVRE